MSRIDHETLMSYCDGELDEAQAQIVRFALEHDELLRAQLQSMQAIDGLLRAALTPKSPRRPLPGSKQHEASDAAQAPATSAIWRLRNWIPVGAAVAACATIMTVANLVTSGPAGWLKQVDDGIAVTNAVLAVVEKAPSGRFAREGTLEILPVLSFAAKDGRLCRELHVSDEEMATRFIVCRDDHGDWCMEAMANLPRQASASSYRTAGVPKDPVIDAAYARLGVVAPLDRAAEADAIKRGWAAK
jgi:hypothetical protein